MFAEEPFIREIVAQPDDDAPRLIFADWLEEQGDPRGEFIRVQCELAQTAEGERRAQLRQRERELLQNYRAAWIAPLGKALIRGVFRRGLLEQIEVHAEPLLAECQVWFEQFPILTLQTQLERNQITAFRELPQIQQVRSLRLSGSDLRDAGCLRLLNTANIGPLQELWLRSTRIGPKALEWILPSPLAQTLEVLLLSDNHLGAEGGAALSRASLPRLNSLYLTGCGVSRSAAKRLRSRHPSLVITGEVS